MTIPLEVCDLQIELLTASGVLRAVDGVSFSVQRGETVTIIGESGSGKSTTAMGLLRLLPDDLAVLSGRALIDGVDVVADAGAAAAVRGRSVALIPQDPMTALSPVHTVGSQLREAIRIGGKSRHPVELLAQVHIRHPEEQLRKYPHQLSGGMLQRVLIAMALAGDPALLVADEPTSALDVTVQAGVLDLMLELQERTGVAILMITHDLGVARLVSDRIHVMRGGQFVESGEVEQIVDDPHETYTRELLAAVPRLGAVERRDGRGGGVMSAPLLSVRGLTVEYPGRHGAFRAVDDVSFDVQRGRPLALVGESGCGKSTIARAIVRLLTPTAGSILLEGTDIAGLSERELRPIRARVQMVFQDPYGSLDPHLTAAQIVEEPLRLRGVRAKPERAAEAARLLDRVGLPEKARTRRPAEFSGGQRQRIGIARALASRPELLVCDEATSALDVSVQAQVLELLAEIQADTGMTCLVISHNLGVVRNVTRDVVVMSAGRIVEAGPTERVLSAPEHPYTRALRGAALDPTTMRGRKPRAMLAASRPQGVPA